MERWKSFIQGMVTELEKQHGCIWTSEDCTDQVYPPPNLQALLKLVLVPHIDHMSVQAIVSIQVQLSVFVILSAVLIYCSYTMYLIYILWSLIYVCHSSCILSWTWQISCSAKMTSYNLSAMPSQFLPAFPNKLGLCGCLIMDTSRYNTPSKTTFRLQTGDRLLI